MCENLEMETEQLIKEQAGNAGNKKGRGCFNGLVHRFGQVIEGAIALI